MSPQSPWQQLLAALRNFFSVKTEWEDETTYSVSVGPGHLLVILCLVAFYVVTCRSMVH